MSILMEPTSLESNATLEIQLPDSVAAIELQALLAIAQYVYSSELWLARAEDQPDGVPMPDMDFVPAPDDRLMIEGLEIGTPNKVTLKGRVQGITAIATLLTTLIGVPTAGAIAYKTYAEGRKAQAEAAKILEETELLKFQRRNAERLEREGKMSEESLRSKQEAPYILAHYYSLAAPLLIPQHLHPREA